MDNMVDVRNLKKYFPIKGVKGPGVQAVEDKYGFHELILKKELEKY